jgi:preprotein translocase subunit SecG
MIKRSRKETKSMTEYYIVIGAFVAICIGAIIYVLLNPKKSFSQMQVIDESQILVHNGQQSSQFQQGTNEFFKVRVHCVIVSIELDSA